MNAFELARASSVAQARELLSEKPGAVLKAGGIDLLDHLKERLVETPRVVDLKSIPGLAKITADPDGGLRIGPMATLAGLEYSAGDAVVEESACRVGQHIKAVLRKPVIVPVPLVGAVAGVAAGFPLVFVVGKPVQQDDQRVAGAGARLGQRQIDIEQRFIPAGDLTRADADATVSRAVVQAGANDAFSPVFSAVSPGVAVLVDERDLDRARELYASFFGEDTSPLTGPAYDEDTEEEAE